MKRRYQETREQEERKKTGKKPKIEKEIFEMKNERG